MNISKDSDKLIFPDIIISEFVNLPQIQQIELCGDNIYFLRNNMLFSHKSSDKINVKELKKIASPQGKILYLYSISNILYLVVQYNKKNTLYKLINNEWLEVADSFPENFNGYICYDNKFAIFYTSLKHNEQNYIYFAGNNGKYIKIFPDIDYESIYSIKIFNDYLYIALRKPNRIIKTSLSDIISTFNNSKTDYNPHFSPVFDYLCYNFVENGDSLLFAADGPTVLVDEQKNTVFSDEQNGQSGYQIAASAILELKNPYEILGTWRRNVEHPLACLYILRRGKLVYKTTPDIMPVGAIKPWTGFNTFKKDQKGKLLAFTCEPLGAVLIRGFESYPEFAKFAGAYPLQLACHDDALMVYQAYWPIPPQVVQTPAKTIPYVTPEEPVNLYITIDVEQHIKGKPYCLTGEGLPQLCGVTYIMDVLEKYGLKGVFFVNIYEHQNFAGDVEKLIKDIHERGHEVGLHCHDSALPFNRQKLSACTPDEQRKIIAYGMDFIKKITGKEPFSFRAGGYNINDDTLKVLDELGIKLDSSVFLAIPQNVKYKSKNQLAFYGNLAELPVTCILSNDAPSKIDMNWSGNAKKMLEQISACHNYGLKNVVMMLHSFSFIDFTLNEAEAIVPFEFTSKRHIKGIKKNLMWEFDKFCSQLARLPIAQVMTFQEAGEKGFLDKSVASGSDNIPLLPLIGKQQHICPVCGNAVDFQPYRQRKNALCPHCHSLERMRFKMLYLKNFLNIENCSPKKILHFGPALIIQKFLSSLPQHDYITSDPYNAAHFKFSIEDIPFENDHFDLIICVGVLMHVLDDHKALAEMRRVLKPRGEMLLWLGNLATETTKENYDRHDFSKMIVGDTTYPEDLNDVITKKINGKIFYNPRFRTRIYGKDILKYLIKLGFKVTQIFAKDITNYKYYGITADDILISCIK